LNARKIFAKAVENWPAKVLSIGLAIILFVFHRMSALEERFFSVPLNIERSGSLVPASPYPRMIRVSLRGEANSLFSITEGDIEVYVDMDGLEQPGVYTVPVQWRKRGVAAGTEPVQITVDPMEVTISLDHRLSKAVPLAAALRGHVEAGHTITSYYLNPAEVVIEGPAGLISGISEIFTEAIDLDGRRSDFSITAMVLNRDPLMIIRGSGTTEFNARISQIIPVRNIPNVPISITFLAEEFIGELEIYTGNIRLEGASQYVIDRFMPPYGFLRVDCSEIDQPGVYTLRVLAGIAENVNIMVEPEEVTLRVSFAEREETP